MNDTREKWFKYHDKDYQAKAFTWWRSLSINEMKAFEKKYDLLYIGGRLSMSSVAVVFEQEIENKPK